MYPKSSSGYWPRSSYHRCDISSGADRLPEVWFYGDNREQNNAAGSMHT